MWNFKGTIALVVCLLAGLSVGAVAADKGVSRSRTDQLIVQFSDDNRLRIQSIERNQVLPDIHLSDGRSVKFMRRLEDNAVVVQLPDEISLDEAWQVAAQLAAQPGIEAVEPDKRFFPALVPNDPEYPPGVNAIQDPGQWHLFEDTAGIRIPAAWDQSTGSAGIVVAVLDTGIIPHRDIDAGRVLPGYYFFSGGLSNLNTELDNDTILGDPLGRDSNPTDPGDSTVDNECAPGEVGEDSSWHGLSVASVVVATSDNNTDIAGIDFAARLLPIRVLGKCGGNLSDVADAIRWAAGLSVTGVPLNTNPADVINLSISGDGACSQFEQDAINAAVAAGTVVVTAAGNEGGSVQDVSPANCNNVITVGAIARDGKIASYVNVGPGVDLTAPGGDDPNPPDPNNPPNGILALSNFGTTTVGADALAVIQGTSFSAAQVSAVASLMLAVDATLSPNTVESILKATTRAFPDASCTTTLCGTGVLDASAAVAGAANPSSVLGSRVDVSKGGGGCSLSSAHRAPFDPLLSLIMALSGLLLACRRLRD
jgi:serine protease